MNDSVERCSYRMISIRQREIHVRTVLIGLRFFVSIRPYRFNSLWMGTLPLIRSNCPGPLVFFTLANISTKRFCLQSVCTLLTPIAASQSYFILLVIIPISPSQFWLSIDLHKLQILVILIGPILKFDALDTLLSSFPHVRTYVCVMYIPFPCYLKLYNYVCGLRVVDLFPYHYFFPSSKIIHNISLSVLNLSLIPITAFCFDDHVSVSNLTYF